MGLLFSAIVSSNLITTKWCIKLTKKIIKYPRYRRSPLVGDSTCGCKTYFARFLWENLRLNLDKVYNR